MKKQLLMLLSAMLCFIPVINATAADEVKEPEWGKSQIVESYTVGPGIQYQKIIYPDMPLILWYTVIDLTNPLNSVEQAQSRDQVPDVLRWTGPEYYTNFSREGHNVKVMWNHDFFSYDQGICIGMNISNGEMTWQKCGRSLLAITKQGTAEVFNPNNIECKVTTPDNTSVVIDRYNRQANAIEGDCVLFNRFNGSTLADAGKYIKLLPQGEWTVNGADIPCKVVEISDSPIQSSKTEYVLYLRNGKQNALDGHIAVGDILTVTQKFNGAAWGTPPADIVNAFHGYPSIAHDGKFHDGEYNNFESGREYEKSAHVMAGISKDKTKLYMLINEMSANSLAVDCIGLTSWMILRGAWDVVNFDSGGSATITVDNEMLNLPGRGSVRPIEDAMLAVSLAPTDNAPHHIAYSRPDLKTTIISSSPLRLLEFNQYDEVLDKGLKGCTFTCEPSTMGYVDSEDVFHSSGKGMSGKIIATKDGMQCELPVTTASANKVYAKYSKLTTDTKRRYCIEVLGSTDTETYNLDSNAFNWVSSDDNVCVVENGILIGKQNGKATLTATYDDMTFSMDITVENSDAPISIADISLASDVTISKSGTSAITVTDSPLPTGWTEGKVLNFDLTGGRNPYIKFTMDKVIYGLPEYISTIIDDSQNIVKNVTYTYKDALGNLISKTINTSDIADNQYKDMFTESDETPFHISRYPIHIYTVNIALNNKSIKDVKLPIQSLKSYYSNNSGVNTITKDSNSNSTLNLTVNDENVSTLYKSTIAQKGTLYMYSSNGLLLSKSQVVLEQGNNDLTINTKFAVPGVYFVTLQTNNDTITGRCIIR